MELDQAGRLTTKRGRTEASVVLPSAASVVDFIDDESTTDFEDGSGTPRSEDEADDNNCVGDDD
jgi:hypothetical protein